MTSPTHISFSLFTLAFASVGQGMEFNYENALLCALGSLTPDLDNSKSWLGRIFPFISKPVENKFSHRTLTHSLLAIVFIFLIAVLVKILFETGNFNPLAFAIGYTSHILIDCASVQGVKILYPFSMRNAVFPFDTQNPEAYRVVVGSKADLALGFVFVFLTIPFAYISFKTHTKIVREIQRDINSAVRSYNELSKNFICWARLEGINTTTGDKLRGDYLIISAEKQNMLLIKEGSLTLSVGKDNFKNEKDKTQFILIELHPNENIRFVIKPQDTIKEGQTIAYRQTSEIERLKLQISNIQTEISQTENEIKALDERFKQDTTKINLKLAQIEREIPGLEELKKRGLAGPSATFKLEKEKESLLNKIKQKQTETELKKGKLYLKIETLKTKIKEIELKITDLEVKNTIKSTATGRLKEIRESATKSKRQFLLILE